MVGFEQTQLARNAIRVQLYERLFGWRIALNEVQLVLEGDLLEVRLSMPLMLRLLVAAEQALEVGSV